MSCQVTISTDGLSLELTWRGLRIEGQPRTPDTVIIATITLHDEDSIWTWRAENLGGKVVESVTFPIITGIGRLGSEADETFIAPSQDGRMFRAPFADATAFRGTYPSSFMNMQFMALTDPLVEFVERTEDTAGSVKVFRFEPSSGGSIRGHAMQVDHFFDLTPRESISIPYPVVISALKPVRGDWTDVAEVYKQWAMKQWWSEKARARPAPDWLSYIGLSKLIYLRQSDGTDRRLDASGIIADRQYLGMPLLTMVWGWEKYGEWFYGDYFPPRGGWDSFDSFLKKGRQQDNRFFFLISPHFLEISTELWKSGTLKNTAMVDANGNNLFADFEPGRKYAYMDLSALSWRSEVVQAAGLLAQHGADVVQLDNFPWTIQPACHDTRHGHPPGRGGNWQSAASRTLLEQAAQTMTSARRDALLSGEGGAELYIPWLTFYHSRDPGFEFSAVQDYRNGAEPVPLFEYVYHPLVTFLGQWVLAIEPYFDSAYARVAFGRAFAWGQLPCYNSPALPNDPRTDPASIRFLKAIGSARLSFARKYLVDGTMLSPPKLEAPGIVARFPVQGSPNLKERITTEFSAVQVSAWTAPDGAVGIILVNTDTRQVEAAVSVELEKLLLPDGKRYAASLVRAAGTIPLGEVLRPGTKLTIRMDPLEPAVIEILSP
jgi:hypothetical protein